MTLTINYYNQVLKLFEQAIKCPITSTTGGPLISFKANPKSDQITVVWTTIETPRNPIENYILVVLSETKEIVI